MNYKLIADELYHYGVKGMKWGVRKKNYSADKQNLMDKRKTMRTANREYSRSFNKAYYRSGIYITKKGRLADAKRWNDAYDKAVAANKARSEYKQAKKSYKDNKAAKRAADRALAKMEKQQYKDFVKKRSKEILAGESALGKIWDVTTNAHKYQAELEYNLNKRAQTDERYRD